MLSRDGLGGSTGKGKGSGRIKVMHILRELKEVCGADMVLIKSETRKLRREADSDEAYKQIIDNNNEKITQMMDQNLLFVLSKYKMSQEDFDTLLNQNQDEEVKVMLNSLCAAEM